jgi:hypothetical protein
MKEEHAKVYALSLCDQFAIELAPFHFNPNKKFKIEYSMGCIALLCQKDGKAYQAWDNRGCPFHGSIPLHRSENALCKTLVAICEKLSSLDNEEDRVVLWALDGMVIPQQVKEVSPC